MSRNSYISALKRFGAFALVGVIFVSLFATGIMARGSKEGVRPSGEFSTDHVKDENMRIEVKAARENFLVHFGDFEVNAGRAVVLYSTVQTSPNRDAYYEDAYVYHYLPNNNYGSSVDLASCAGVFAPPGTAEMWSYLKFDLSQIPPGVAIIGARIYLWCNRFDAQGNVEVIEVQDDSWSAGTITWNSKPSPGSLGEDKFVDSYNCYYDWNVLSFVQSQYSGDKVLSLCMVPGYSPPCADAYFNSNEASGNHPYLEVTYVLIQPPSVTINFATDVTGTSATLNGNLDSMGGDSSATVWFQWGRQGYDYEYETTHQNKTTTGFFSDSISGLSPGTTYHFRAVAQNSAGLGYGSDSEFTTFNFALNKSGDVTVTRGFSGSPTITASLLSGSTQLVNLSGNWIGSTPSGVTVNLSPTSDSPTFYSALTITASPSASIGTFTYRITGVGGGVTRTVDVYVYIQDFTMSVSPSSGSVTPGKSTSATVTVTALGGYNRTVTLSASGAPSGVTISFSPTSGTHTFSSSMNVSASPSAPTGTYTITVTGTGADSAIRTTTYTLTIWDFSVSVSPPSGSVASGGSINATVTVNALNGYNLAVTLSASGLPSGASVSFNPTSGTPTFNSAMKISTSSSTPTGTYIITITGAGSDSTIRTANYTLVIPITITTVEELQAMNNNLSANYVLVNDIDASDTVNWNGGAEFKPIGTDANRFTGTFDGQGYEIINLYINRTTTDFIGLFGYVGSGGVVENVGMENENVIGNYYVGGLVGWNESATVTNCYSTGTVSGTSSVGGLVGFNFGTVSNSYSTEPVSGTSCVGGLVGGNGWAGIASNSYATGSVSGDHDVGGLVGVNGGTMFNSYSTGSVSGAYYVGGLVGYNTGTVSNSFWDIETSGRTTSAGGTGKTTENMKNVRTYTDNTWSAGLTTPWDFVGNPYGDTKNEDIWNINSAVNNGYPFLNALITQPYIIHTVEELQGMKDNRATHYALGNDIDASATINWNVGAGFVPIGTGTAPFTGSFDGQGYEITNLYINRPDNNNVGLFGVVGSGGVVESVGLEDANVSGSSYVGGLVGRNYGTVTNSYSTGSVSGTGRYAGGVGGLVGYNYGTVSKCYSTGVVSGSDYETGGLVGRNVGGGLVNNSYSTSSVSGSLEVGGLVGWNDGDINNCYSMGSVSGAAGWVGGLIGYNTGTVSNSFWDIETSGRTTSAGGTGKTTENMKNVRTCTDTTWSVGLTTPWDFIGNPYGDVGNENIWGIAPSFNDGYPFLRWQDGVSPPTPSLLSPPNGVIIGDETPTFKWTAVSDLSGVTYQIEIDDNADFSSLVYSAIDLADNAHTLPDESALALGTYYWHVRAEDGAGNVGDWSGSWTFTVTPTSVSFTLHLRAGWNMVSFPVMPDNLDPDSIFSGYYAMFGWNAASPSYVLCGGSSVEPDEPIAPGVGYWVNVFAGENVVVSGTPVNNLTLSLSARWNLIGSPLGGASVANPDDTPDNSVLPFAFTWTGSSYELTTNLVAGAGYWVNAMNNCVLRL